jgi:hypothetical protein
MELFESSLPALTQRAEGISEKTLTSISALSLRPMPAPLWKHLSLKGFGQLSRDAAEFLRGFGRG